ncbi:adh short and/or KR domain containing protein, partial [Asbolus verrucosus]
MEGRTVIITGSNRGIGKATAMEIAKRGARIILACRNLDMAEKVQKEIIHETKNRSIVVKKLDLSSQKSIREFAAEINKTESSLNVLLHNAGIVNRHIEKTEDNLELTMATNHFGPFLLTHLLI